jgi:hypothetical protein
MAANEVAEVKPRRLRDIRADLETIIEEIEAVIADHPEVVRQDRHVA